MSRKTLDKLRQPDKRSLTFVSVGLGVSVRIRPDGAEYQQQVVAKLNLDPKVANGTRRRLEDLLAT